MKNYFFIKQIFFKMKIFIFSILTIFTSLCTFKPTNLSQTSNSVQSDVLIYKSGLNSTLFYSKLSKDFYFIQYNTPIQFANEISFEKIEDDFIIFRNNTNNSLITYKIGSNGIFGITKLIGLERVVFINGFTWVDGDISEKVTCKCIQNNVPSNCDSGGVGSSECSQISTVLGITSGCTAKCDAGTYACCVVD